MESSTRCMCTCVLSSSFIELEVHADIAEENNFFLSSPDSEDMYVNLSYSADQCRDRPPRSRAGLSGTVSVTWLPGTIRFFFFFCHTCCTILYILIKWSKLTLFGVWATWTALNEIGTTMNFGGRMIGSCWGKNVRASQSEAGHSVAILYSRPHCEVVWDYRSCCRQDQVMLKSFSRVTFIPLPLSWALSWKF